MFIQIKEREIVYLYYEEKKQKTETNPWKSLWTEKSFSSSYPQGQVLLAQ